VSTPAVPRPAIPRRLVALGAAGAALLAATGAVAAHGFSEPTAPKYAVTVLVPLIVAYVAVMDQPLRLLVPTLIVAAPFGAFTANIGPVAVNVYTALLLLTATTAVLRGPQVGRLSPLGRAALPTLACLLFAIGLAHDPIASVEWLAAICCTAWLVSLTAGDRTGARMVVGAIALSAAVQGALALVEFRTGHQLNVFGTAGTPAFGSDYYFGFSGENRPTGSFTDPNSLGNVLAVSLPLVVLAADRLAGIARLALVAVGVLVTVGLVLTFSRMSWIGGTVGLLIAVALLPRGRRLPSFLAVATLAVATVVVSSALTGNTLGQRASSILHPTASNVSTSEGDDERIGFWRAAIDVIEEHPVTGVGLNNLNAQLGRRTGGVTQYTHAHSTFLQLTGEGGAFAAVGLVLLLVGAGRSIRTGLRGDRFVAAAAGGALAAMLIVWVTDFTVRYTPVAAMEAAVLGLAAGIARSAAARPARTRAAGRPA
jgi:O-antigen ligase